MRSIRLIVSCLTLITGCTSSSTDEAGLVIDAANLLTTEQSERIATFHGLLLADDDIDYRVVTTRDAADIDSHAVSRFEALGTGESSSKAHGLLLVVDSVADRVRLEVGYALEGTFPDAFIAYVEQRQMAPFFAAERVADGILATTELIVSRAQNAKSRAGLESRMDLEGSGGASATTAARLGAGTDISYSDSPVDAQAGPADTLAKYFGVLEERNSNPSLQMYTPATQRMLEDWVTTPAQMDNVVRTFRGCHAEAARIDATRRYAVIRYPIAERQCSPWFFEKIAGLWALDPTMMQRAIRFGRDNSWHFERRAEHPYEYAFDDWVLDSYGYPQDR